MPYTTHSPLVLALLLSAAAHAQNSSAPSMRSTIVLPTNAQASEATQEYCASEWPQDAQIQKRCIDQQNIARAKSWQFASTLSSDGSAIWAKCRRDWTNSRGFLDWVMMSRCLNFEAEAYKE